MKHSTVIVKVTLEVQIPIELEDDDNRTPAEAAKYDLENTAVSDWWRQLNANWTVDKVEPTSVVNHDQEDRAPWEQPEDLELLGGIFGSAIDEQDSSSGAPYSDEFRGYQ